MNNKQLIYTLAGILLVTAGCRKGFKDVDLQGGITIHVTYPEHFTKREADNATVVLRNTNTGEEKVFSSDGQGNVYLEGLLKGNYVVQGSRSLTPAEALALVGLPNEFNLNGVLSSLVVNEHTRDTVLNLNGSQSGAILFKEVYYTGSRTPAGGTYFSDQFYELYNNTDSVLYADGLCIANTGGASGQSSTGRTYGFMSDPNHVYLQNVWMIPGNGTDYPIQPGGSIIIAQDGINHQTDPLGNAASPVNLGLGVADFESYVPRSDNRDLDSDVPNLQSIYLGSVGFDWLVPVFGPGMVIFRHAGVRELPLFTEPNNTSASQYMQVPVDSVFDAVDLLANATAINFKRIPVSLDAGFSYCSGTYVGEAVRRKVSATVSGRKVLQDFNNSTVDFEVVNPPRVRW